MEEHNPGKRPSALTIDRAAFLLLRVKKAFKKKRQQRKDKNAAAAAAAAAEALGGRAGGGSRKREPPPLLRSRTLPAIVVPGLSILHAQIDPNYNNEMCQSQMLTRGLSSSYKVGGLRAHAPRISFTCKDGDSPELQDVRRKSASSRLGNSPRPSIASSGSDDRSDSNVVLRVPSTHVSGRASVCAGAVSGSAGGAGVLARLIAQGGRAPLGGAGAVAESNSDGDNGGRRLSWERREQSAGLPRSSSIDSMVEAVWAGPRRSEPAPVSLPVPRPDRALSLVSPAVGRRAKAQRGVQVSAM